MVKSPPGSVGDARDLGSIPVRKIPWRRKWQPTPLCLPGKFHRQRSLAGYNPWGHKELDITECLNMSMREKDRERIGTERPEIRI